MSLRGLFRKRTNSQRDDPVKPHSQTSFREEFSESESTVEEKDTLAIMYDIIVQIRNDPEYARSIYANCPRLQHLLEKRPDLRPIFENPRFVRINFEDVYRKEGGVLPEDEEDPKKKKKVPSRLTRCVVCVVTHPLFKVLRVLILIKKIFGCIFGGGFALVSSLITGCFCESAADLAEIADIDGEVDADAEAEAREQAIHEKHQVNREALNKAADHLEDPKVQAQMEELMKMDPDQFAEAIENDDNLRALRDSSPVCVELMSDPETMRIVCDPDNLRALGEAPELIEMDFADPDWTPLEGDVEMGGAYAEADIDTSLDVDVDTELGSNAHVDADIEDGTAHGGTLEDIGDGDEEYEVGTTYHRGNLRNKDKDANDNQQKREGMRDLFAQVGASICDVVASELVGFSIREMTGGGDDGLGGITDTAGAADTSAIENAVDFDTIEDAAEKVEDTMDEVEIAHKDTNRAKDTKADVSDSKARYEDDEQQGEQEEEEDHKEEKKKRFGIIGGFASSMRTAAKEYVAEALLGEGLGELLVEKIEEKKKGENKEDAKEQYEEDENEEDLRGEKKEVKKTRGVFRR